MPSPLVILRFRRQDDSIFYRAFSSSDEERPLYKFDADLHYEIGNQRLHEDDMSSVLGTILSKHVFEDCQIPLAERNNGIQVFVDGSGNVVEDGVSRPQAFCPSAIRVPERSTKSSTSAWTLIRLEIVRNPRAIRGTSCPPYPLVTNWGASCPPYPPDTNR